MKAVVFKGEREIEFMEFPDPTPGPGEVVLEIKASGMCGSDLKFYRAPAGGAGAAALGLGGDGSPNIGGHEPCGVVCAIGSGVSPNEAHIGQRVMVHHYHGCGVCNHCRVGWSQMCDDEFVVYGATGHGAHAPYMKVPAHTLVTLPEEISFSAGAAIACGTGTAYGALRRLDLSGRDVLAIYGQGPVGLSATQFASAMGAQTVAVDISDERLAFAKDLGADVTINSSKVDPVEAIKEMTHGKGAEKTLDCSGIAQARAQAVKSARSWGTVCFVGEGGDVTIDVSNDMIRKQLTIVASWTFSKVGQAECTRYVADREIDVDRLFTDRYKLDEAVGAYVKFDKQNTGKGVFEF